MQLQKELTLRKKLLKRKFLKKIEKKKLEKDIQERFEKELACIATIIEKSSFNWFQVYFDIADNRFSEREQAIVREAVNRLSIFLKKLGYEICTNHEYNQGWKTRSGRFGYLTFKIPE